ncbi:MAG: hypothetical protein KDB86_02395 [Actinobacteria bacterium]|nr:hypothetical protein [Actinomycetota bacterium]MCB9388814.1 hypothetical protein [Acidimicrobiia bacterium]
MKPTGRKDFRSLLVAATEQLRSGLVLVVIVVACALPAYALRGSGGVVALVVIGGLVAYRFR